MKAYKDECGGVYFGDKMEEIHMPMSEEEVAAWQDEIKAEKGREQALSEAFRILTTKMHREIAQSADFSTSEFAALAVTGLFDEWSAGVEYWKGRRFTHGGVVYEVKQDVVAQAHQPPGSEGMLAVYRPISANPETVERPDDSLEKPYGFIVNTDVRKDKYRNI